MGKIINNLKRNKKSQIFSTLVVVFVFIICSYAIYLHFKEKPKIDKEITAPLAIFNIYNQEQDLNQQYFNSLKEAVYASYVDFTKDAGNHPFVSQSCQILNGGIIRLEDNIKKGEWVAMLSLKGELVAIGKATLNSKEIFEKNKGLAVKTDRVLMKKGTCPKIS